MKTFTIEVTQEVEVTLDEAFFSPEFLAEFQRDFYSIDSVREHAENIAQQYARGVASDYDGFIEGYGETKEMNLKVKLGDMSVYTMIPNTEAVEPLPGGAS